MLELATRLPFVEYLFPEQGALQDFQFTDFLFSKRSSDTVRNKNITIINFSDINRKGIARLIDSINTYDPKVIALDAFFNCAPGADSSNCASLSDPEGTRLLAEAIRHTKNVVLLSRIISSQDGIGPDDLETSDPVFTTHASIGFGNFPVSSNSVTILRTFIPKTTVAGKEELSFGLQIARQYDSTAAMKFLRRKKTEELINFSGNTYYPFGDSSNHTGAFVAYEWDDVIQKRCRKQDIKDRVIIIGYLGHTIDSPTATDIFFSPLNSKPLGRAYPDITGPVVQANVVATILDNKPINSLGLFGEMLFALIICTVHIILLFWLKRRSPNWYDSLAVALIIIMLAVAAIIRVELFTLLNIKSYLALTLASLALSGIAISIYENFEKWWNSLPDEKLDRKFYWISIVVAMIFVINLIVMPPNAGTQFSLTDVWFFGLLIFNFTMFFVYRKRDLPGYKNFMRLVLIQAAVAVPLVALYLTFSGS